jgi:hypothetical protein
MRIREREDADGDITGGGFPVDKRRAGSCGVSLRA